MPQITSGFCRICDRAVCVIDATDVTCEALVVEGIIVRKYPGIFPCVCEWKVLESV